MLAQLLEGLGAWIVSVISAGGYAGILALMAIESACIPLPSELIMPFAGYLVSTGQLSLIGVAVAGAIGCNIGSTIAYAIGAWAGRPAIERWGRFVLLTGEDIDRAQRFFERFGSIAVFAGRLLPVVRTFIALPAGFAHMSMWKFQLYTFAGSLIWCLALAWLGQQLGIQWDTNPSVKAAFHNADIVVVVLLVLAIGWFVWHRLRRSRS
jgi:membrane protein DedA with SNARE-associated domain